MKKKVVQPRTLLLQTETVRALSDALLANVPGAFPAHSPGPGCKPTDMESRKTC